MQKMTWSQVCARRLQRHFLDVPSDKSPADVVRAMAATHAQVMSASELGVGLRIEGATRQDLRDALWRDESVVKTFGPRGTVHLVPSEDLPMWLGALTEAPSPHPITFMTPEQADEVVEAVRDALLDDELTIDELDEAVVARTGEWAGERVMPAFQTFWPRWRQVMHLAAHRGALRFGAGRGRKVTYRGLPGFAPMEGRAALRALVPHYLNAYGPATPEMFAHWLNAPRPWARELFAEVDLHQVEVERVVACSTDLEVVDAEPQGVRLLPYFDNYSYVVGNHPRELLYPGAATERLRGNFQVLLVDGVAAGLWHHKRSGKKLTVVVEPLREVDMDQLDAQVTRVGEILEATPTWSIGEVTVGGHA